MAWPDHWKAIAARIEGITRAAEFAASAFKVTSTDMFGVVQNAVLPELESIKAELSALERGAGVLLPPAALASLKRFLGKDWKAGSHPTYDIQIVIPLVVFRAEFEYLLRDNELQARSRTELAFEHLKRLLVVDSEMQAKWQASFQKREEQCERLGAVHLLSHGIWAFKVTGVGAATDLVFGDPLKEEMQTVRDVARSLVLTEWKVVRKAGELNRKIEEARRQIRSYSGGILSDIELKRTRYIVLVCEKRLSPPPDYREEDVEFRHIVIAVRPDSPAKEARVPRG